MAASLSYMRGILFAPQTTRCFGYWACGLLDHLILRLCTITLQGSGLRDNCRLDRNRTKVREIERYPRLFVAIVVHSTSDLTGGSACSITFKAIKATDLFVKAKEMVKEMKKVKEMNS